MSKEVLLQALDAFIEYTELNMLVKPGCQPEFERLVAALIRAALAQSAAHEIAALKAAQPVEPASKQLITLERAVSVFEVMKLAALAGDFGDPAYSTAYIEESIADLKVYATVITQPAPAAPYQVTDEDAETAFLAYVNSPATGLVAMRHALEACEARKAAA